jgi:hypothetical protein
MVPEASTAPSLIPDAEWMRARLDELCSFDRESASAGELQAAEWLAGALQDEGVRDVRVEEEPEANGTFWWSIGLLTGGAALAGLAARRGGRAARLLAAATGAAAAALAADELPPGRRRFRRLLPKRSCHHVLGELGPHDAERTIVKRRVNDSTRVFTSRSITVMRPRRSSQTRKRAKTRTPTRFSEMNTIVGALLPGSVVVVETVVVPPAPATTPDGLDIAVACPAEVCAVTSARIRWPTSAERTP